LINLYDSKEINFNNNGLVVLSDCISCTIIEELNGPYELQLEYPLLDSVERAGTITPMKIIGRNKVGEMGINQILPKWQYLLEGNIIKADGQLFRIYHKIKTLSGIKVNARHIFYDLLDNFLEDVRSINTTGRSALDYTLAHTQFSHPFTSVGDVGGSNTRYFVRKNEVEAIMGQDGIINTWGGELVRDNFSVGLWNARGLDRGVLIAYGKNIQGIEETLDMDSLCTRLMPTGKDGLLLPEKYVDSPYINNYPHPKIKTIYFNDCEEAETLRTTATKYMLDNKIDIPQFNYKIDFLELSKTEEYKNFAILERVDLGDTVTVKHSKLAINLKAKVIKTTKNILTGRLEKVELGDFKPNIATSMNSILNVIDNNGKLKASELQGTIDATKTSMRAMTDGVTPHTEKCILFEDRVINSPTYGAMALGTKGFEIASVMTNNEWQWTTFGTGQGFIADMIIAGKILGNNAEFNLDEGFLKVTHADGSYTKIDAAGMNRYVGGTGESYHYLSYTCGVSFPARTGGSGYTSTNIQLPAEFKGKDMKVSIAIKEALGNVVPSTFGAIASIGVNAGIFNKTNAIIECSGYFAAIDTRNNNAYYDVNEHLKATLTVIA
jgi:phage minor structural protein